MSAPDAKRNWAGFSRFVFGETVASVHPSMQLADALPDLTDYAGINLVAAGKGAAAMAADLLDSLPEQTRCRGIVIAPHGAPLSDAAAESLELYTGAHPVPDEHSLEAGKAALMCAQDTKADELFLVLLTGGASAVMCCPVAGVTLKEKQDVVAHLLRAGAPIQHLNAVRRVLSTIKGGGLLKAAAGAKHVCALAISDVVSNDARFIGSGPTVPLQDGEVETARAMLIANGFDHLRERCRATADQKGAPSTYKIIASAEMALEQLGQSLINMGFERIDLGGQCEGEAKAVAADHAKQVLSRISEERIKPNPKALAFLSGGELTVTVSGAGQGGPNQEYALAAMQKLESPDIHILAFDTDGQDGIGGAAGAFVDPTVRSKSAAEGLDIPAYLASSDSGGFFKKSGGQLITGASGTNVNDIRLICWFPKHRVHTVSDAYVK